MRRTASEVIRDLEMRVARLERRATVNGIVGGFAVNPGSPYFKVKEKTWSNASDFFKDVKSLLKIKIYDRQMEEDVSFTHILVSGGRTFYESKIKPGDAIMFAATNHDDERDQSGDPFLIVSQESLINNLGITESMLKKVLAKNLPGADLYYL